MSESQSGSISAKDFMGTPIVAGCTICYPVRRGSSMWLKKLVVRAVRDAPKGICVSGVNENQRTISIYNLDNCIVAEVK